MKIKICNCCGKEKVLSAFSKQKSNNDGYHNRCKECTVAYVKHYSRSLSGLITQIYSDERASSKRRGHTSPGYSKEELTAWLFSQGIEQLYVHWKTSGYQKPLRPSVDRLDSNLPYSIGNIRLVTWEDNKKASFIERKECKYITKQCQGVQQMNSEGLVIKTFKSIASAARATGINRGNISAACSSKCKLKLAGGFRWKYAA